MTVTLEKRAHELLSRLVHEVKAASVASPPGDPGAPLLEFVEGDLRCVIFRVDSAPQALSPREAEIARMVARGLPNKAIADVLDISPWTVCTHLRRIFAKLDVPSRAAMVAKLLGRGGLGAGSRRRSPGRESAEVD